MSGTRRFLDSHRETIDSQGAQFLQIAEDAEIIVVRTTATIDGRPVGLMRDVYPAGRLAGIDDLLRINPSPTAALRQLGILDYTRKSTRISSRMPSSAEAGLLEIARTRPLLETTKIDVDMEGRPVVWGTSSFPADRVHLVVE
jgi:GntR family phosphonate transport system transcriptional regulator